MFQLKGPKPPEKEPERLNPGKGAKGAQQGKSKAGDDTGTHGKGTQGAQPTSGKAGGETDTTQKQVKWQPHLRGGTAASWLGGGTTAAPAPQAHKGGVEQSQEEGESAEGFKLRGNMSIMQAKTRGWDYKKPSGDLLRSKAKWFWELEADNPFPPTWDEDDQVMIWFGNGPKDPYYGRPYVCCSAGEDCQGRTTKDQPPKNRGTTWQWVDQLWKNPICPYCDEFQVYPHGGGDS